MFGVPPVGRVFAAYGVGRMAVSVLWEVTLEAGPLSSTFERTVEASKTTCCASTLLTTWLVATTLLSPPAMRTIVGWAFGGTTLSGETS